MQWKEDLIFNIQHLVCGKCFFSMFYLSYMKRLSWSVEYMSFLIWYETSLALSCPSSPHLPFPLLTQGLRSVSEIAPASTMF